MNKLKHCFMFVMVLCMAVSVLTISAAASENNEAQIINFEDGSYVKITIESDDSDNEMAAFSTQSTKYGTKTFNYYNSSDKLLWAFHLHGAFTYNGSTAKATDVAYTYEVYDNSWSLHSAAADYSDATVKAVATFKRPPLVVVPVVLSLTCSPTGVLS